MLGHPLVTQSETKIQVAGTDIDEVSLSLAYLRKNMNVNFSYLKNNLCTVRIYRVRANNTYKRIRGDCL